MLKLLFYLDRLQFKRSPVIDRLLLERAIIILFRILLLIYAVLLGINLPGALAFVYKTKTIESPIYNFLIIYFSVEFIIRYFLDKIPKFEADKYLHLPIPKKTIIQYILGKSFFTITNILATLIFIPYCISQNSIFLAISIIFLSLSLQCITALVKSLENSLLFVTLS